MTKLIFDIDDNRFEKIKCANDGYFDCPISLALCDATILSADVTNGDIIKAILNLKDEDIKAKESCISGVILEYVIDTDIYFLRFDASWWNAPYEG